MFQAPSGRPRAARPRAAPMVRHIRLMRLRSACIARSSFMLFHSAAGSGKGYRVCDVCEKCVIFFSDVDVSGAVHILAAKHFVKICGI